MLTRACTPKMPSPYLHPCAIIAPCAVLSKCNRSYTIQRILTYPNLSTCAFVWLFVSTHDTPPGLGREVMLTFTYPYVSHYHVPNLHTILLHSRTSFKFHSCILMCNASVLRVIVIPSFSASPRLTKQMRHTQHTTPTSTIQ